MMHSKPTQNQLRTNSKPTHSTHTQGNDQVDEIDERDPQHLIRGGRIKDGPIRMTPEELRETRKRLGVSIRSFARLLGLSDHMMLWHWERGNQRIPLYISLLVRLVGVLQGTRLGERMGL
jgi:DNA-binding transcriptional regulator YiaG